MMMPRVPFLAHFVIPSFQQSMEYCGRTRMSRGWDTGHGLDDGFVRNPATLLGASPPSHTFENRNPAPLAAPAPAPVTNGPAAQSPYPGIM